MTISAVNILIFMLAAWRVCNLVANEDGPFGVFSNARDFVQKLEDRNKLAKAYGVYNMLECEYCNSIWMSFFMLVLWVIIGDVFITLLVIPAASTGVIFIKVTMEMMKGEESVSTGNQRDTPEGISKEK